MQIFTIAAVAAALLGSEAYAASGELRLHLWKPGYRAEREPLLQTEATEGQFRLLAEGRWKPASPEVFSGCYLATFQSKKSGRIPASNQARRICIQRD